MIRITCIKLISLKCGPLPRHMELHPIMGNSLFTCSATENSCLSNGQNQKWVDLNGNILKRFYKRTLWRVQQPQILTLSRNSPTPTRCSTEKNINNLAIHRRAFSTWDRTVPLTGYWAGTTVTLRGRRRAGGEDKIGERMWKETLALFISKSAGTAPGCAAE